MLLSLVFFIYLGHRITKFVEKTRNPWLRFLTITITSIYCILWILLSGRNPITEITTFSYIGKILIAAALPSVMMVFTIILYLISKPFPGSAQSKSKFEGLTSNIKPWKVNYRYVGKPGKIDDYGIMATLLDWGRKGYIKFWEEGITLTNIPIINSEKFHSQEIVDEFQIDSESNSKSSLRSMNKSKKKPSMDNYEKTLLKYLRELSMTGLLYQDPESVNRINRYKIFKLNRLRTKVEEDFNDYWKNSRFCQITCRLLLFIFLAVLSYSFFNNGELDLSSPRDIIDLTVALDIALYLIMIIPLFTFDYTEKDEEEIIKWLAFKRIIEDPKTLEQYGPKPNEGDLWEKWLIYSFAVGAPKVVIEYIRDSGIELPHFEVEDISKVFSKLRSINQKIKNRLNPLERIYYGLIYV